jgi:Tectonin domain
MVDFQSDFDQTTNTIDDTLRTQVSSSFTWRNVPGSLVKASASSAGYVWGFNQNSEIYICQLPCSGNWTQVTVPNVLSVLDVATDASTVYILGNSTSGKLVLNFGSAMNQGNWVSIPVPFAATRIFSTHTYIWAQDGTNSKQKCAKPCTTGNWIPVPEKIVSITSSSDTALYGVDPSGTGMRTDEIMQSEWIPVSGLKSSKLTSLIGDLDSAALYAVDNTSHVLKCEGNCSSNPVPINTSGYVPLHLTADPHSLWMTAETSGDLGNVFNRASSSSYTDIINSVTPLDQKRDAIVDNVKQEFEKQTDSMTLSKQLDAVVTFFKGIFNKSGETAESTNKQAGTLKDQIAQTQAKLDQMTSTQPLIQNIVHTLVIVGVIYLIGSILGKLIHLVAIVVLFIGLYYSINFSQGTNNG